MQRTKVVLILMLLLLGGLVALLALRARKPPFLPADEEHVFMGEPACLACHSADGVMPRGKNHPVGRDCMRCHASR